MTTMTAPSFSSEFRGQLNDLFRWRRDVRHFRTEPVPEATLDRLLETACLAPSVGLSQPWRFLRVDDPGRRSRVREEFKRCNAEALAQQGADRAALYARLKLAGLDDAPHHIAVFCEANPAQGYGLGRMTMPETIVWSAVMSIHTFWLAAEAEEVGVGWVSILDPLRMADYLGVDPVWTFLAYLCVGIPADPSDTPELERRGWEHRHTERAQWIRR
jgi:5,6-dimethylbenzimidazole synthase